MSIISPGLNRPLLLDLYCGVGGAAKGYYDAGFDIIGVDINRQPNYPFTFVQADALDYLESLPRYKFDVIHASPPCQHHSTLAKGNNNNQHMYPDLLEQTRSLLNVTDLPYVIENVQSAPLLNPIRLCGEMFGLEVIRHRLFESNIALEQPKHIKHRGRVKGYRHGVSYEGYYYAVYGDGGGKGTIAEWQRAMGIYWTDVRKELAEAIPPAFSYYVGKQLLEQISAWA